jgi:hypothetical protein
MPPKKIVSREIVTLLPNRVMKEWITEPDDLDVEWVRKKKAEHESLVKAQMRRRAEWVKEQAQRRADEIAGTKARKGAQQGGEARRGKNKVRDRRIRSKFKAGKTPKEISKDEKVNYRRVLQIISRDE